MARFNKCNEPVVCRVVWRHLSGLLNSERRMLGPEPALKIQENSSDYRAFPLRLSGMLETQDLSSASSLPESKLPVLSLWSPTTLHVHLPTGLGLKPVAM